MMKSHRIMEWFGFEEASKLIQSQTPAIATGSSRGHVLRRATEVACVTQLGEEMAEWYPHHSLQLLQRAVLISSLWLPVIGHGEME